MVSTQMVLATMMFKYMNKHLINGYRTYNITLRIHQGVHDSKPDVPNDNITIIG